MSRKRPLPKSRKSYFLQKGICYSLSVGIEKALKMEDSLLKISAESYKIIITFLSV